MDEDTSSVPDLPSLVSTFGNDDPAQEKHLATFYKDRCKLADDMIILLRRNQYYERVIKLAQNRHRNTIHAKQKELPNDIHEIQSAGPDVSNSLQMYGELFGIAYSDPAFLSRLYFDPHYNFMERLVNLLTLSLLPNHYDLTQEHIMMKIIEDVMSHEFDNTEDLTTYLRENTAATKLLGAYLKREHIKGFIDSVVEECGEFIMKHPEYDVEVDPEAIWESLLMQIEKSHNIKSPNDKRIEKMCEERRAKLSDFINYIMDRIMKPTNYPLGLRNICRKLMSLAKSKQPENDRLAESLVGGFIFLRIFNPRIQMFGHEQARLDRTNAKLIRRRFTLIVKIMQNISNQVMGGVKEPWMATLNDLIQHQISRVKGFFKQLADVRPLEHFFDMDRKIREKSPEDDIVFMSIADLNFLKKMLTSDMDKRVNKGEITAEGVYNATATAASASGGASDAPSMNKHEMEMSNNFYRLVKCINESDPFKQAEEKEAHSAHYHSTYVRIGVHQYLSDTAEDKGMVKSNQDAGFKLLSLKVVPILQQLDRRKDLLMDLEGIDLKADLKIFLMRARDAGEKIYGIGDAVKTVENTDHNMLSMGLARAQRVARERTEIFLRLRDENQNMGKAFQRAKQTCEDLQEKLKQMAREREAQQQELEANTGRDGRGRFMKLFGQKREQETESKESGAASGPDSLSPTVGVQLADTDIVSTEGIIGNMLVSLVADIGLEMRYRLQNMPNKVQSVEFAKHWSNFPESVATYEPILQRVSRLGMVCMHELIKTIIESDEDNTRAISSRRPTRFRLNTLDQHFPKYKNSPVAKQIMAFTVDFIMADVLQCCFLRMDPGFIRRKRKNVLALDQKLMYKWVTKLGGLQYQQMGDQLGREWTLKRHRKWGVIIALITDSSPQFAELAVDVLQKHCSLLLLLSSFPPLPIPSHSFSCFSLQVMSYTLTLTPNP